MNGSRLRTSIALASIWSSLFVLDAATAQTLDGEPAGERGGELPSFVHEVWTAEDGLPVNSINGLVQSRDGYVWAATFDGLVRFDGVRFTVFNTGNSSGLPSNRIVDIHEAPDGVLWLRSEQGYVVRLAGGRFTTIALDEEAPGNTGNRVYIDPQGRVWVGTAYGFGEIRGDRFEAVARETIADPVEALYRSVAGTLWIGAGRHVYAYADGVVRQITDPEAPLRWSIRALYEDPFGSLWIGTVGGAYRYRDGRIEDLGVPYSGVREFLTHSSGGPTWLTSGSGAYLVQNDRLTRVSEGYIGPVRQRLIQEDEEGRVWLAAGGELIVDGREVFRLTEPTPQGDERDVGIIALLRDHEGSIWLGTAANGLHRLKPSLFSVFSEPEGLSGRNVYGVVEDPSGDVWLGVWGSGVSRLRNGRATNFRSIQVGYSSLVLGLAADREGHLWLGGGAAVWRCDLPDLTDCEREITSGGTEVRAIFQDASGDIWAGTGGGLFRRHEGEWSLVTEVSTGADATVRIIIEAADGALWMGTSGSGVLRLEGAEVEAFTEEDGLPGNVIRALYQDASGWVWVGTEGRGLARIDAVTGDIVSFRAQDGLFDEGIHMIIEDDFGRLWMSTNRGIFWVSRDELLAFADGEVDSIRSTAYSERHGMRNREANGGFQQAGMKTADGRLWFPTQDGVVIVDPADLSRNAVPPSVVIERLVTSERSLDVGADTIELGASERDLQIDYTGLSFMAPENMRFRYMLEGYDPGWVDAGNRRIAFYTRVPPGDYTFRVIASNDDAVWNEQGAAVGVVIAPFFYESTPFRAGVALLALMAAVAGYRLRVRSLHARGRELEEVIAARTEELSQRENTLESQNAQLEAQAERLEELDRAKSRFFANVSHEFRTPLTLTIGPLEDLQAGLRGPIGDQASTEIDLALRNSRRLLRLVNQILDVAKLEARELRPRIREDDAAELARTLGDSFMPLAERKKIDFHVEVPDRTVCLFIDADLIEKSLANLLSNAFKFTPEGGAVRFTLEEIESDGVGPGRVELAVRDTGPGIESEALEDIFKRFYQVESTTEHGQPGTGIGLSLAKELVELHGGSIQVESTPGFGSTFTVLMRCGSAHLDPDWFQADGVERRPPAAAAVPPELTSEAPVGDIAERRAAVKQVDAPKSLDPEGDQTTILVVEDNDEVRAFVTRHLESRYRVLQATSGRDGLEAAAAELPDLIVSDVMMPGGMDGFALCAALKADPALDFIPVILLTARASDEAKLRGLQGGADDYVTKPFDFDLLEARIDNLVGSRRRLRERLRKETLLRPAAPEAQSADERFLAEVGAVVEAHLDDEDFDVDRLAEELGYSRSTLYRKLEGLTDESPAEIVHNARLDRAAQLIDGRAGNISEIAYAVGYKSVSHFSRRFRQRFGAPPSLWRGPSDDEAAAR